MIDQHDSTDHPDGNLQGAGERIRKQLSRLSWGVPSGVMLLMLLLAFAAYQFRAKPQALEHAHALQREAAERVAAKVDGLAGQIDRIVLTVRDWAQQGVVNLDDPAGMNRVLIPVIQQRSIVSSIHLANEDGREVLLLKLPDGWKNRVTDVPKKGTQQKWLSWKDARNLQSEEWKEQDYDPRKRPWYTGVMAAPENRVFWTAPYIFQSTQEPGITAALRWTDKASGKKWVVAFDVLLSDLTRLTLDMGYAQHGNVALLAPDGKVLGLPRGAGFDTDEAINKSVMQEPGAIGLSALASALKQSSVNDTEALGTAVPGPEGVWLVKLLRQPLRNQEFQLALMAPQSDFSILSPQLILAATLTMLFLGVAGILIARRINAKVTGPVSVMFEQLGAGNRELANRGARAVALAALSTELQKAQSFAALGDALLCGLAQHMALGQGSLYVAEDAKQRLVLCSGFARQGAALALPAIAFGEGLVGQCGLDRQALRLDHPPTGYLHLSTALGNAHPRTILIQPVLKAEALLGVIELALIEDLAEEGQALLASVLPTLALCMEILERNQRTDVLLVQTQVQAEEMAAQNAVIEATEAWYRGIIESAPDGMLVTNEQGVITLANPKLEAMFGYGCGELVGNPIEILVPQAIRTQHVGMRDGYADRGENRTMGSMNRELRGVRKDGSSFAVEVGLSKLPAVAGRGANVCASVRDITERKRVEMEIQDAKNTLEIALTSAKMGSWKYYPAEGRLEADAATIRLYGLDGVTMDGSLAQWFTFVDPDDAKAVGAAMQHTMANQIVEYRTHFRVVKPDHETAHIMSIGRFTYDDAGQAVLATGLVWDISDIKRAEAATVEERTRLQSILDKSPICISITAMDGEVLFANPVAKRLFGLEVGERAQSVYVDPKQRDELVLAIKTKGLVTDFEVDIYDPERRVHTMSLTAMVTEFDGQAGLLVWQIDITERKAGEEKLRLANFLSDQALDLTKAGHWHIPLNTGDEFYNSSERAASIFGDPPRPDWRYHLMNEWFTCVEAGDKEAAARTFENFNAALAGTVPRYDATYAYKRPIDDRVVWIHAMGQVVRDDNGTPTDMFGVTVDVTDAKQAESQLAARMNELERFNRLTIDREGKMIELKGEINTLLETSGKPKKYRIVE